MYGLEILQKCGKKVETKSQKILGSNPNVCTSYSGETGRGMNLFKTFIKVRYILSGKFRQEKVFVDKNFCHLANILPFFPDKKLFLRYNEFIWLKLKVQKTISSQSLFNAISN